MTITTARPGAATRDAAPGSRPTPTRPTRGPGPDVQGAVTAYRTLGAALPGTTVRYAVGPDPDPALLRALRVAGARLDVASPAQVRACLAAGARPAQLILGSPAVARADLEEMVRLGVRLVVVDSPQALIRVAAAEPDAAVLCRLATSDDGSAHAVRVAEAVDILTLADQLGLEAAGVSLRVSLPQDPQAWEEPVAAAAEIFGELALRRIHARVLDLGSFPGRLSVEEPDVWRYGRVVREAVRTAFGHRVPHTIVA